MSYENPAQGIWRARISKLTIAVTYVTFTSNTELGNLAFFPVIAEETDTLNRNVARGTMHYYAIHLL